MGIPSSSAKDETGPSQPASSITKQPWPFPFNILQEEWPEVKKASWSFFLTFITAFCIGFSFALALFTVFILPGKDAQIAAKEETNAVLKEQKANLKEELDRRPAMPEVITSSNSIRRLKNDTAFLCAHLDRYNTNWSTNAVIHLGTELLDPNAEKRTQFETRFKPSLLDLRERFKEHGVYPEHIDLMFNDFLGGGYKLDSNMVFNLKTELTNMVNQLK